MWGALVNKINKLGRIDPSKTMQEIIEQPQVKEKIITKNQEQLYDKGVQADGSTTGNYSTVSVEKYGKPQGHIRLFDTGEFYESMKIKNDSEGFTITADTEKKVKDYKDKGLTVDLLERWKHPIGLTNESKTEIKPIIAQKFCEKIRKQMAK